MKCIWVKFQWEEVSISVVRWSEGLNNRVSTVIRRYIYIYIYIYQMKFAAYMADSFITFFHIIFVLFFMTVHMVVCFVCFCLIGKLCILIALFMYSYYVYVFLLLCIFRSQYFVSLCCSVYCLCVNVHCSAATGCQHNCS